MPSIQYWFSGAALYLAGSFAFAVIVGLIGIRFMISRWLFMAMMVAALLLTMLAWRTAAKQEEASAKQDADNAELKTILGKIANSANIDPNQSAESLANKIIEKMKPLADQVDKLANPPRLDDVLYQEGKPIAHIAGLTQSPDKIVVNFQAVSSERMIDFSKEIELQNTVVFCSSVRGPVSIMTMGASQTFTYVDVACAFLRLRK